MWQRLWILRWNLIDSDVNACNFHRHPLKRLFKIELKVMQSPQRTCTTNMHHVNLPKKKKYSIERTLLSFGFARCSAGYKCNDLSVYFVKLSHHIRMHKIQHQWTKCMHDVDWQAHYTWHKIQRDRLKTDAMQCKRHRIWRVPMNVMAMEIHNHFGKAKQHDNFEV